MMERKDDILLSLEGLKRAEPDPKLYASIQAKIANAGKMQVVRRPWLAVAAACLALLICANIWAFGKSSLESRVPTAYQIDQANFNLY